MSNFYLPSGSAATAVAEMPITWRLGSEKADMTCLIAADTIAAIHWLPGFAILEPIPFQVEHICDEYVLTDEVFNRYGSGDELSQAREDLANALADYFRTLQTEVHRLSRGAREQYEAMQMYVST